MIMPKYSAPTIMNKQPTDIKSKIKKIVGVAKHKHGDYISTPINEKELSKSEKKTLKKIEKELRKASKSHKSQSSALAKSTKAHKSQADRIAKLVKEKLSVEEEGVEEKKLTAAEKKKKEDIIMALKKQKGGKKKLEPVDYAVATDSAKKLAEKNEK